MHIATNTEIDERLLPRVKALHDQIADKSTQWMDVVKIGRTHLEDAVPLTVGHKWSGWAAQLKACLDELHHARNGLLELRRRRGSCTAGPSKVVMPRSSRSRSKSGLQGMFGENMSQVTFS
jgi:fumarate hydratase class II